MKKIIYIAAILGLTISTSGCLKKDTMENIDIYTTVYPIEFITRSIYENNSSIYSIYPDGTDVSAYSLTSKQISDYSKSDLYIYNGLSSEKDYAIKMLNDNKNIKIIDSSMSMEYANDVEELWLDPSNFLMLAQNIKNGFKEYITNSYLENEVNENYDALKIKISEIDANLKLITENAINKTIVVSDDLFLFLEKYNFNVISLENNSNLTDKKISDVKALINNGTIKYVFVKTNDLLNDTINSLITNNKIQPLTLDTLSNLTESQKNEKLDFIDIMNNNIELLKKELYQ
ncbi:MAG: metal ABC transporter substrate-binding protein [Bacilli bacterium]|nr:metal ABC transporter substrate-binding protein [Bacilli bacterium]